MEKLDINWLKEHPYVKEWRSQDVNSYLPTVNSLNENWSINANNPVTISRVHDIVHQYLILLGREVKQACRARNIPQDKLTIGNTFGLNNTETSLVLNQFSNPNLYN